MADTPIAASAAPTSTTSTIPESTQTSNTAENQATNTGTTAATVAADAQAVINDPNATKAEKKEAKKVLKQLTLKVDGKSFTENLPFDIPDDPKVVEWMTKNLQMSKMAGARSQYAAGLERDVKQFLDDLKANPIAALSDPNIGIDVKKLAEQVMLQEIEDSKKTPEQKELEKAKKELQEMKSKAEKDAKERTEQEQQRLADKYAEEYDTQISQALESKKIPKSEAAVKRILAYAELAVQSNKDVTINDIVDVVKDELAEDARTHISALSDDQLESFLTKELFDRIRKIGVKKVKQAQQNPAVNAPGKVNDTGKKAEKKEEKPKVSYKTFFGRGV